MSTVIDLHHRKACLPCATAKRKCNKGLPVCHRCIKNQIDCQYPSTRRYVRNVKTQRMSDEASHPIPSSSSFQADDSEASVEVQDEQIVRFIDHETLQDQRQTSRSPTHSNVLSRSDGAPNADSAVVIEPNDPHWFLGPGAWLIDTATAAHGTNWVRASTLKHWIESVSAWFRLWIDTGHNPFIHRYLYFDTGLPPSLQDAWMILAAYHTRTKDNEDTTLSIIEAKAQNIILERLLTDESSSIMPALDVHTRLAHVQSLFIFQLVRLFDGDIRQRAMAEKEIPTLNTWCDQLWYSAKADAESSLEGGLSDNVCESCPMDSVWKKWILSESVRRVWLLVNFMHGAYLTLRDGRADCPGAPRFTARRGMWDAASSEDWAAVMHSEGPLFTSLTQIDGPVSLAKSEIDGFSAHILVASVGMRASATLC